MVLSYYFVLRSCSLTSNWACLYRKWASFQYDSVISFTQTFSDTTCGLGGIGGQAFTDAQIFIFVNQSDRNAIVIGPAWSYFIEGITEKFSVACCNHYIAGVDNIAKLNTYGYIKEIKRA